MVLVILSLLVIIENIKITDGLCCSCTTVRTGAGCPAGSACEQEMCYGNIIPALPDDYCCTGAWDGTCANNAQTICNLTPSPTTSTTKTPTTKTIYPTLAPTNFPKISCGSNQYCYYVDIYPSLTSSVSEQIVIQNTDETAEIYFDIIVSPRNGDCVSPSISFQFELIDYDQSGEYLDIYNNAGTRIKKCNGGPANNCPNWDTCLTNKDLGISYIKINNQYTIRVIEPYEVNALCNGPGDHDLSINAILTFQCAAGTVSPTPSPTSHPTSAPTPSPTINPTASPTTAPTSKPTPSPTLNPTASPTTAPTSKPTFSTGSPTRTPSESPTTKSPTFNPTQSPTPSPTTFPTPSPTFNPTAAPTTNPTAAPTNYPTNDPTTDPTLEPTTDPTDDPTFDPTTNPTAAPTFSPTKGLQIPNQNRPTMSPTTTETTKHTMNKNSNTGQGKGGEIDSESSNVSGPFSYILISSIGALFIILCIAACIWLCCRKKKHVKKRKEGVIDTSRNGVVADGKQQKQHHVKVHTATGIEMGAMMRIQSLSAYDTDLDVIDGMDDTFITPMGLMPMDDGMITPEPNIINIDLPQLPPQLPQLPVATENDNQAETEKDEHNSPNNDGEDDDDDLYHDIGNTATPNPEQQQYDNNNEDDDDDDDDEQLYTDPEEETDDDDDDVMHQEVTTGGGGGGNEETTQN